MLDVVPSRQLWHFGDWASSANWTTGSGPPNDPDHTAIFADTINITGPTNVSTTAAVTVNRIQFSNTTHNFAISGLGSVNLSANTEPSSVNPSISVQGTHQFQAAVNLLDDTAVDVASDSTLTFNNTLDLMSHTLTKTGAGTLSIRNDLVLGGGTVDVQQGTVSGNGTIGGDVINDGGILSPGNSSGVLSITGGANSPNQVPEPAALALLLLGGLVIGGYLRRRRK
jgi:fibronectin-binding autotransporter adhesin